MCCEQRHLTHRPTRVAISVTYDTVWISNSASHSHLVVADFNLLSFTRRVKKNSQRIKITYITSLTPKSSVAKENEPNFGTQLRHVYKNKHFVSKWLCCVVSYRLSNESLKSICLSRTGTTIVFAYSALVKRIKTLKEQNLFSPLVRLNTNVFNTRW